MLRGSSRHDGIPNKQSAKDRDRDRQREQQRKERAQMLPDDKEIHPSAQDLFHAPVKVKPSDDTTTVQIRNTLGNFDTVRHLMIDGSARRLANLVGVDQGTLAGTLLVGTHRFSGQGSEPPPYRPPNTAVVSLNASVEHIQNSTKSHYHRNLFPVNPHTSGISNSSNSSSQLTNNNSTSVSGNNLATSLSRTSLNPNLIQKVPLNSHNQLPIIQNNTGYSSVVSTALPPVPPNAGPPILNTRSPNIGPQGRTKTNFNYGHNHLGSGSASDSADSVSASSLADKNNSVFNNEPIYNTSVSTANDKRSKSVPSATQPPLERADSNIEVESILKEMMEVTPPLTAIQTPIKENNSLKKLPLRRSSKSEEKIVQSIRESGMASVPSPVERIMDSSAESSSSSESDSESESEESSSGSQPGGIKDNSVSQMSGVPSTSSPNPQRWHLSSFLPPANSITKITIDSSGKEVSKSPKDTKVRGAYNSIDSETSLEELNPSAEPSVTSTSVINKSQSGSPLESLAASNTNCATTANHKVAGRTRSTSDLRQESNIPSRAIPPSIPSKGNNKISSLSGSSSDEEVAEKPKKTAVPKPATIEDKKVAGAGSNSRKRPRPSSASANRHSRKSDVESSPERESALSKAKKVVQDRNKSDTIRKLFRPRETQIKKESPSLVESDVNKSSNGSGGGKQPNATSNRVSAKGEKKSNVSSAAQNGELDPSASFVGASNTSGSKKKDTSKDKDVHGKKHSKQSHSTNSVGKSTLLSPGPGSSTIASKGKDDNSLKTNSSLSSLIVRIPLDKISRKSHLTVIPSMVPSVSKPEKDSEKASKGAATAAVTLNDSYRLKGQHNSSRVGSSSDPSNQPFGSHDPSNSRDRDDVMCSDPERPPSKNYSNKKKPKKKSRSSPKKSKIKREPDSHTKLEEDLACGEVSSNVLGYAPCDSVSVSTTRTPPTESDIVQAPDSSLNPPHLPSPVIPPQLMYYSYFEKNEHKDDLFSRDQDSYLEEAKKLKHSADGERTSTTQASMYLEAGLYFILTGILMERESNLLTSSAPYTMYKDTLTLITFIGSRWRSRQEPHNLVEAKIITLSMRCQALLSLKLFKMKMRETREMVQHMNDYFTRAPPREAPQISNSPQLSTPSPHSPTSSPAGSSGVLSQHTPSPHHPHQNHHLTNIPRNLYTQIHKHCNNSLNVITAHDIWEQADNLVTKHHLHEFFIAIDRQFGPLTLHSSLVDLVRYVRHGLQLINAS